MPAIELRAVGKRFGDAAVVDGITLEVAAGETLVLIGPSGCGKSTTLKMMNGLVQPSTGTVVVGGKTIGEVDPAELRLGIGYVIQDVGLFAHWTVRRNVGLVPQLLSWSAARTRARTDELLALVGLPPDEFADRFPAQLSGGQRQRVGIARALAADPPVVLLDEPFGALDPITREHLQDQFLALSKSLGKTFVLVTHDIFEAVRLGDHIAVLKDGRLLQYGTPAEIVRRPADSFVESLMGRHRYQLRLMTLHLREALAETQPAADIGTQRAVSLPQNASLWEALDLLESEKASYVEIQGSRSYLSRAQLLDAVSKTSRPEGDRPWESASRSS